MSRKIWMLVALMAATVGTGVVGAQPLATADAGGSGVEWRPMRQDVGLVLTISGPEGFYDRQEVGPGQSLLFSVFDAEGGVRPAGTYAYELRAVPQIDDATRASLEAAREAGGDGSALRKAGKLPTVLEAQSGAFTVADGSILMGGEEEARPAGGNRLATKDQVIPDDLIVQGSICVGFDCVNGESFGFDTIRLKENNTRIKFEDTSTGSFPTTDWQLTANDSASGGQNKFSIEDITGAKVPFTIEGGSTTNSIYVDSTGRVGFRTSTPVLDVHVATSNTPGMRLEQTNAGGFTAQTWDLAGNEANFFVRDVTGGSRLPFRIRPGAPTSSIDVSASGNVGFGTTAPSSSVHVSRTDGTAQMRVTEGSTTEAARELAFFENNGTVTYRFTDTQGTAATGDDFNWLAGLKTNNVFILTPVGTIGTPAWQVDTSGNVTATSFNPTSSREVKEGFASIEPEEVLAKVRSLPISEWSYRQDVTGSRHLGPMAEDFRAAFGLGQDSRTISVTDLGGVSLAAIQGLAEEVEAKDRRIQDLESRIDELEALVRGSRSER